MNAATLTVTGLDPSDYERASKALRRRLADPEPMVGDFVLFADPEPPARITHEWGPSNLKAECRYQTTPRWTDATCHHGFFLTDDGEASYSGTLDDMIPGAELELVDTAMPLATYWFFRHGEVRAHNGVWFQAPTRAWRYTGSTPSHRAPRT